MKKMLLAAAALFALSACSTIIDRETQEMTFKTPGAEDSMCIMERAGLKQRVWPPQTVRVTKNSDIMTVHCVAPGNRARTVSIEPEIAHSMWLNVTNGFVPGFFYDHDSGALFKFPEVVIVDFRGIPATPTPLPAYQRLLQENPMLADVEEFRPGRPFMQRDRMTSQPAMQKYDDGFNGSSQVMGAAAEESTGTTSSSGPDASGSSDSAAPVPLYDQ